MRRTNNSRVAESKRRPWSSGQRSEKPGMRSAQLLMTATEERRRSNSCSGESEIGAASSPDGILNWSRYARVCGCVWTCVCGTYACVYYVYEGWQFLPWDSFNRGLNRVSFVRKKIVSSEINWKKRKFRLDGNLQILDLKDHIEAICCCIWFNNRDNRLWFCQYLYNCTSGRNSFLPEETLNWGIYACEGRLHGIVCLDCI